MTVKYAEDKAVEEDSYLRVVQYCSFVWEGEREGEWYDKHGQSYSANQFHNNQ